MDTVVDSLVLVWNELASSQGRSGPVSPPGTECSDGTRSQYTLGPNRPEPLGDKGSGRLPFETTRHPGDGYMF